MLSGSKKFQKRKNKVSPEQENVSLYDLANLVKRLSVQVDDLVVESNQQKKLIVEQQQQQQHQPPSPAPAAQLFHFQPHPITVDPWASHVPQNYGALLQRLEDMDGLQRYSSECCSSVTSISTADGVPWPKPLEPFRSTSSDPNELLDQQYTHWCTLMRCLPLMDPVTSVHVKTVGLYAMREILKIKANQKRENCHYHSSKTTLRDSMSWGMPPSETLPMVCMNQFEIPAPPLPPKEAHTATTPTPCMSPASHHQKNRFQRWIKQKTSNKKIYTPSTQSPTLNKSGGSWLL